MWGTFIFKICFYKLFKTFVIKKDYKSILNINGKEVRFLSSKIDEGYEISVKMENIVIVDEFFISKGIYSKMEDILIDNCLEKNRTDVLDHYFQHPSRIYYKMWDLTKILKLACKKNAKKSTLYFLMDKMDEEEICTFLEKRCKHQDYIDSIETCLKNLHNRNFNITGPLKFDLYMMAIETNYFEIFESLIDTEVIITNIEDKKGLVDYAISHGAGEIIKYYFKQGVFPDYNLDYLVDLVYTYERDMNVLNYVLSYEHDNKPNKKMINKILIKLKNKYSTKYQYESDISRNSDKINLLKNLKKIASPN